MYGAISWLKFKFEIFVREGCTLARENTDPFGCTNIGFKAGPLAFADRGPFVRTHRGPLAFEDRGLKEGPFAFANIVFKAGLGRQIIVYTRVWRKSV